jgi:4-hydroxy-2-oxoheptanedioate aldolase
MAINPLTETWKQNGVVYTGWLSIPCSWSAEVMAHAGFDALVIDMQHGLADRSGMLTMLQAIGAAGKPALVRAAWNEPSVLMQALDAGAYGVICPMISTREDCEAFVAACRYPPRGIRSYGPTRSLVSIGEDYVAQAETCALSFAQIETAAGLANIEAIAAVPGLDGLYVGPWDLSLDLGLREPGNLADPRLITACETILAVARRHQLVAGIYVGSAEDGLRMASWGFQLVNIATDTTLLHRSALSEVRAVKGSKDSSDLLGTGSKGY